mmetsp:Transcript_24639/g.48345  ORF Transcript_24639/g.48345 Transcript_24639/m.48345 type:complete len:157 (+) Transcript_24639:1069-1539(+)
MMLQADREPARAAVCLDKHVRDTCRLEGFAVSVSVSSNGLPVTPQPSRPQSFPLLRLLRDDICHLRLGNPPLSSSPLPNPSWDSSERVTKQGGRETGSRTRAGSRSRKTVRGETESLKEVCGNVKVVLHSRQKRIDNRKDHHLGVIFLDSFATQFL